MHQRGELKLAPEFQREAVWPRPAKAYLIDTILADRPIPLLFFNKTVNPQTNRSSYEVVDGQQRLRAIIEFMDGRFRLPNVEGTDERWKGLRYPKLQEDQKIQLLNYELSIVELKNYSQADIRDIFVRMNKYVARLNAAELRRAREEGAFKKHCTELGELDIWEKYRILTRVQQNRLRSEELAAEITILLAEGPQDKKDSVDLYYSRYSEDFPEGEEILLRLQKYIDWIDQTISGFSESRWRKPVDLYALLGALDDVTDAGENLEKLDFESIGRALAEFDLELEAAHAARRTNQGDKANLQAVRYLAAAGSQTDNILPRRTRISTLEAIISRHGGLRNE